jgi:hypothetical protein
MQPSIGSQAGAHQPMDMRRDLLEVKDESRRLLGRLLFGQTKLAVRDEFCSGVWCVPFQAVAVAAPLGLAYQFPGLCCR